MSEPRDQEAREGRHYKCGCVCLAAEFLLDETQMALILYGMAPLCGRIPRDAAFIVAFQNKIYNIHEVDAILRENDLPPFLT